MSALVFSEDRQLCEAAVLAVDAQRAIERSGGAWDKAAAEVNALIAHLRRLATLKWWFANHEARTEVARRELLAHRDYVNSALFIAAGDVGDYVEGLLEQNGFPAAQSFREERQAAARRLQELALAIKFLLEEDDPTGEVERAFSVPLPPPQPDGPSVDFDFN